MVFLKRGDEAISTLRGGLMHAKTDENRSMLNAALTAALLSEAQKPLGSDATAATMLRRFRLLEEASELDPKSQAVTQCIVNACIASYQFRDIAVEQARDSFYGLLSEENLRFIEGTVAIHAGDIRSAKTLLAADAEEDASSPGVLNNLAHAILQEKEPDLQEALNLCNAAVEALPNHAYFRETRGQVLFRLARYGEAIKDLEIAFLAPELRPGIQMMMLKCYQELKLSEKEAQLKQWIISQRTATQP
jgi:tetratricopeptide (TPR) repeat protein